MKIEKTKLKKLMSKHIFELSEEELKALAFLLDIEISGYSKSDWQVKFAMRQKATLAFVECSKGANISMGKSNKVKKGLSGLTSWGGMFSFAHAVSVFRHFHVLGYELTIQSPEALKIYDKEEWKGLVLSANDLVEAV